MVQNKFIRIPATLISNPEVDDFVIVTYAFLAMTKCSEILNSFAISHFCRFINKKEDSHIRNLLLPALNYLELNGFIKILKTSNGILYETTYHFFDDKRFAIIQINEMQQILNSNYQNIFLFRLFAYIKLKMIKGLYYQSFSSLGRLFNQEEKYIRNKCKLLQELGLIGHIRFTTSYKKKKETKFIRFQIFSDMSYTDWQQRAEDYGRKLKVNKFKISNSDFDDYDLW